MMIIEERGRGTRASCGFSATLGGATQRVWPVEDLWLLRDSVLKFWLPDNLQNIWSTSTSYLSHGKSFSQVHTNFRFDEEFSRIIACPFESGRFSCLIWTLLRWFSCFWGQKCRSNIHNNRLVVARWNPSEGGDRGGLKTRVVSTIFGSWDKKAVPRDQIDDCVIWLAEFMIKNFEWQGKFIWDYFKLLCSLKMRNLSIMRA